MRNVNDMISDALTALKGWDVLDFEFEVDGIADLIDPEEVERDLMFRERGAPLADAA